MMELKGKKVLVVGLGKSGLAAAIFLCRRGAQVTVSDIRSAEALAPHVASAATPHGVASLRTNGRLPARGSSATTKASSTA